MKWILLLFSVLYLGQNAHAQDLYFPPLTGNAWETVSPESLDWCEEFIPPLLNFLDDKNTKAFLLLKDGRIVIEAYFDDFSMQSNWYWASAGKTFTAFAVGMAQQEGLLNISDKTSDYLGTGWTSCETSQEEAITVFHQLSMTTGLDDGVDNQNCIDSECLNCLEPAGSRWSYYNAPYTLLTYVVEEASNQNMNVFINSRIKQPTGMNGLYVATAGSRIYWSTPRSMARFGLLMLAEGTWNETPVITDAEYFSAMINPSSSLNESYGYLWWLNGQNSFMLPGPQWVFPGKLFENAPDDMYSGLGLNGQILNVVPSKGLVMVRMGEAPDMPGPEFTLNDSIWAYLNLIFCLETSVSDIDVQPQRVLFPNPVSGQIALDPMPYSANYRIYNALGQLVFENSDLSKFDGSAMPHGLYILHVEIEDSREVYRFVR